MRWRVSDYDPPLPHEKHPLVCENAERAERGEAEETEDEEEQSETVSKPLSVLDLPYDEGDSLEARNIVRYFIVKESANECNDDSHRVVCHHQQGIPSRLISDPHRKS